jgi:hypothetical protein
MSPVTGFVLTSPDVPTIYVSGDNASLEVVEQIAEGPGTLHEAFATHGLAGQLTLLAPGEQATV